MKTKRTSLLESLVKISLPSLFLQYTEHDESSLIHKLEIVQKHQYRLKDLIHKRQGVEAMGEENVCICICMCTILYYIHGIIYTHVYKFTQP